MRIIDRQTFLSLPPGVLFSKYTPMNFGDICIKGETYYATDGHGIDFSYQQIVDSVACSGSAELWDILLAAQERGVPFEMDFDSEGRDGMFAPDQLFAVWEKRDVESLVARLQRLLPYRIKL